MRNIHDVGHRVIRELGPMTQMDFNKTLYELNVWAVRFTGDLLVPNRFLAITHGPVVAGLQQNLPRGTEPIHAWPLGRNVLWTDQEDALFAFYKKHLAHRTAAQKRNDSHAPGTPWSKTFKKGQANEIPQSVLRAYGHRLLLPAEAEALSNYYNVPVGVIERDWYRKIVPQDDFEYSVAKDGELMFKRRP